MHTLRHRGFFLALATLSLACGSGGGVGGVDGHTGGTGGGGAGGSGGTSDAQAADAPAPVDGPLPEDGGPGPQADASPALDSAPSSGGNCSMRTGGALITFGICDPAQKVTVWITNGTFIAEAVARKGMKGRIPVFDLVDGRDCDAAWSWHVDPATAQFADLTVEVCDGCPALVESGKADWLRVKRYCPWSAMVLDVVDRR
jgi:hypothetical protein